MFSGYKRTLILLAYIRAFIKAAYCKFKKG